MIARYRAELLTARYKITLNSVYRLHMRALPRGTARGAGTRAQDLAPRVTARGKISKPASTRSVDPRGLRRTDA